jgi:alkylation response protein AidB-like acyl-CoA dehydrogenase
MYDLRLTPEQLEFRETVRDFVDNEVKPAALNPRRLEPFEKPLLKDALDKASQMGLRALALSEDAGGAGADALTICIVLEELGAGDVDVAMVLGQTATLARTLFGGVMTTGQRSRFLPKFMEDDGCHLAYAGSDPGAGLGWTYHRPAVEEGGGPTAVKQGGDWVINGEVAFVANAPVAGLFAVQARTDPKKTGMNGVSTLLVPRGTPGLTVREPLKATGQSIRWHHGIGAGVAFKDCKVPADHMVGKEGQTPLADAAEHALGTVAIAAVNLGVARVAYDAAVDYSRIRRQGGRNIIEHQAIGTKLSDCAIRLELARNMIWKAAWALDHAESAQEPAALPLHVMARVYTAEAAHEVTLLAAECFGAMGVMRDMPLQKHVHDAMVFLHSDDSDGAAKLAIAEAIAGYQRPAANAA